MTIKMIMTMSALVLSRLSTVLLQMAFDNMNLACSLMLATPELERKQIL